MRSFVVLCCFAVCFVTDEKSPAGLQHPIDLSEILRKFRPEIDRFKGGHHIKKLLQLCPKGKVQGIDYSAVSVEKARKVNASAIAAGRCAVQQASVAELPFEAEQFDVVTAFETIYFWPELAQNFREVYRVLKPGGTFFICNEANGETA